MTHRALEGGQGGIQEGNNKNAWLWLCSSTESKVRMRDRRKRSSRGSDLLEGSKDLRQAATVALGGRRARASEKG